MHGFHRCTHYIQLALHLALMLQQLHRAGLVVIDLGLQFEELALDTL